MSLTTTSSPRPASPDSDRQTSPDPGRQTSIDELGTPLRDVTFVVVDLETTGGSPATCSITEIGAVKLRGGEVLGEFQTLVDPQEAVPAFIAVLTGITDAMVANAPTLASALPAFLDWAGVDAVLVAHNAPFDLGFLRAGCARLAMPWPAHASVDTARLARRVLTRDEARDCKLATLARLFRATTTPCHRALDDARATADVLHALLERVGPLGVTTLPELTAFTGMATAAQRRKRHLADGLPDGPGVYVFRDDRDRPLYIGRSRRLRRRVRQYFVASEPRRRMAEMVGLAARVEAIPCAHALEASVRELRLIALHKPPYNRRSRHPERAVWLTLTRERFPRLSVVRAVPPDPTGYLGPFSSRRAATAAMAAVHDAVPLRQCTQRIGRPRPGSACVLAELDRCAAPCEGRVSQQEYALTVGAAHAVLRTDPGPVVAAAHRRMAGLAEQGRYEVAAHHRDQAATLVRTAWRMQRLASLSGCEEMVGARPGERGGWEIAVVRHGRLAAALTSPAGADPWPYVHAAVAAAETVVPAAGPAGAASAEEVEQVHSWLTAPDTRLVTLNGTWASPATGAGRLHAWLASVEHAHSGDPTRGAAGATRTAPSGAADPLATGAYPGSRRAPDAAPARK